MARRAETYTDEQVAATLGLTPNQWAGAARRGAPSVRTKDGARRPWPETLHWYIALREQDARGEIPTAVRQTDFAAVIGVTPRQVTNLIAAGLPVDQDGGTRRVRLAEGLSWWIAYKIRQATGDTTDELDTERLLKLRADRTLAEFAVAKQRASILSVEDAVAEFDELFVGLHAALRALPERAARQLVALFGSSHLREIRALLSAEAQEADNQLEEAVRRWATRAATAALLTTDDDAAADRA